MAFVSSRLVGVVALLAFLATASAISDVFGPSDVARATALFRGAQKVDGSYADLASAHHAAAGLKAIGGTVANVNGACTYLKSTAASTAADAFHAASAFAALACGAGFNAQSETALRNALTAASDSDVAYGVLGLKAVGATFDAAPAINKLSKVSEPAQTLRASLAFAAVAAGSADATVLRHVAEYAEDVLAQGEESERSIAFGEGLASTAAFVRGVYALAAARKAAPVVNEPQANKLASYLLQSKYFDNAADAYETVSALAVFAQNEFHVPISIIPVQTTVTTSKPDVKVSATNVLGGALSGVAVILTKAVDGDGAQLATNRGFGPVAGQPSVYGLNLHSLKPHRGAYSVDVSAKSTGSKHIIQATSSFTVKVAGGATIVDAEIAVQDKHSNLAPKGQKIPYPDRLAAQLNADEHQRIVIRLRVRDPESGEAFAAQQIFVRFVSADGKQEAVYPTETASTGISSVTVDVTALSDRLGGVSGEYTAEIIVGDAVLDAPISFTAASIALRAATPATAAAPAHFGPKPVITHLFREPEKRPPAVVSLAFTAIVLSPFLVLLVLWGALGANISNFSFSLYSLAFHGGIGAILAILALFWLQLTIFETLGYLAVAGVVTFLAGNKALNDHAQKRL
eukprot:Opistho-2@10012